MNLVISAAVFPVIFLGELPDKTMIASLTLATRGRARMVWLGAAAAFAVHVVIATTAGVLLFRLLPHRLVALVVAAMFAVGAVLAAREALRREPEDTAAAAAAPARPRPWRVAVTAFSVVFVAEWGDLTQLLTANLAARYHSALSVGLGSLLALWAVGALAVLGGRGLLRLINVTLVRAATAVLLAGLAGYAAWTALA